MSDLSVLFAFIVYALIGFSICWFKFGYRKFSVITGWMLVWPLILFTDFFFWCFGITEVDEKFVMDKMNEEKGHMIPNTESYALIRLNSHTYDVYSQGERIGGITFSESGFFESVELIDDKGTRILRVKRYGRKTEDIVVGDLHRDIYVII